MAEIDTVDTVSGNTRNRSRAWCFTFNNYSDDDIVGLTQLWQDERYVFQEETGEEGTSHLQGVVYYKNAVSFNSMKSISRSVHWERCRDVLKSVAYCSKEETRTGRIYVSGFRVRKSRDPLIGKELFGWQSEILSIIEEEADDRTIHWYWECTGGVGKTSLAKSMCVRNKDCIYVSGKASDIKCAIAKLKRPPKVVIWDVPRSKQEYVSYEALESVKNGIFFSDKYDSGMYLSECPHVFVFANFEPEIGKRS